MKLDEDGWPVLEWFGPTWGAPVCEDDRHAETPVGELCVECERPIAADDQGFLIPLVGGDEWKAQPWHRRCFLWTIVPGEFVQ